MLSEEQMQIGTEEHESGRAHLRKHVVTEEVHRTVPVSHEEVRMVRERITDEERKAGSTPSKLGDGEVEVVLHEEQAVVSKRTVPVERVHLETERVTEQQDINTESPQGGAGVRRRHEAPQGWQEGAWAGPAPVTFRRRLDRGSGGGRGCIPGLRRQLCR